MKIETIIIIIIAAWQEDHSGLNLHMYSEPLETV